MPGDFAATNENTLHKMQDANGSLLPGYGSRRCRADKSAMLAKIANQLATVAKIADAKEIRDKRMRWHATMQGSIAWTLNGRPSSSA